MAIPDNLKNVKQDLEDINVLASAINSSFEEIKNATKSYSNSSSDAKQSIAESSAILDRLKSSAQNLAGSNVEQLSSLKGIKQLETARGKLISNQKNLSAKILELSSKRLNASKKDKKAIDSTVKALTEAKLQSQDLLAGYNDILETSRKIEKSNPFKFIGDLIEEIPVLRKVLPEFKKASDAYRESKASGEKTSKSLTKAASELSGAVTKLAIGLSIKGINDFDERSVSIARNLNISRDNANSLTKSANNAAKSIAGVTGKDITQAQLDFSKSLGTTAALSNEIASNFSILQSRLGLSVSQASKLTKLSIAQGENAKDQTASLIGQVKLSNFQNKTSIRYQDILESVSEASDATLISIKGQGKSLSLAAIEAKKLGLNLSSVDKIAESLLNFESSIASELKAELLTGKALNLEKAREFALNNNIAGVAQEISKQGITQEKFSKMNRIQQRAIAEAIGLSRDELASSLMEQEALNKLSKVDGETLSEKVKNQLKEINLIKDKTKREEARANLIKQIGSDELVRQQENRTLTELQAEAAQKIIEAFDALAFIIKPIGFVFSKIAEYSEVVAASIGGIAVLGLVAKFSRLLKVFNSIKGVVKNLFGGGKATSQFAGGSFSAGKKIVEQKAAGKGVGALGKIGSKIGAKGLGKMASKLLPGVGLAFAAEAFSRGDITSGLLNTGAGIASFFPGIGTAISAGLTAIDIGRDIYKASNTEESPQPLIKPQMMAKGGIVTSPINAVVGEAGPEAVIPLDQLMKEFREMKNILTQILNKEGSVYIDGSKVGKTLQLASSRMG